MATPCIVAILCRNSPEQATEQHAKCALCRFSPDNMGRDMAHYWLPLKGNAKTPQGKHPQLEQEKATAKLCKRFAKLAAKRSKDTKKRKISRLAQKAEKATEKKIIKATKNSGRRNKDGDHVHANMITLDTKLQTTRDNPVIFLHELEKVREDATRAGSLVGGLVIRNKHGVGCVVLKEEDYVELTRRLLYPSERINEQLGSILPIDGKTGSLEIERSKH